MVLLSPESTNIFWNAFNALIGRDDLDICCANVYLHNLSAGSRPWVDKIIPKADPCVLGCAMSCLQDSEIRKLELSIGQSRAEAEVRSGSFKSVVVAVANFESFCVFTKIIVIAKKVSICRVVFVALWPR